MVNEYFYLGYNGSLVNDYGGTIYFYIFELANYSVLALFVMLVYKLKYINSNSLVVWLALFFTPLLFNYFLVSPWLFPDQFQYAGEITTQKAFGTSVENVRIQKATFIMGDLDSIFKIALYNPITVTAKILGLAPLPNWMTVTSPAFANKFFLFLTFLYLKKDFKDENILLLFFLVPSLILYSSLSMRDNIIIIFSILFLISMLKDRFILGLLLLYPLLILKIQMFAFFTLYYLGRLFFRAHKKLRYLGIFSIILFFGSLAIEDEILLVINTYRYGFAAEDLDMGNGYVGYQAWGIYGYDLMHQYTLHSLVEVVYKSILGLPSLLLMPLPWNWSNIFYPIQALESVFLIAMYVLIAMKFNLINNREFIYLTFVLIVSLMLYSLLAFNEGTFVRYRFTLFYPFLLAIYYVGVNKKTSPEQPV